MATIRYNNITSGQSVNLVTFTDIPNILTVTDTDSGGKATLTLIFSNNLGSETLPALGYWYITLGGETITSVNVYSNAINKNFYAGSNSNANSIAASVVKAFRNCPNLAANFIVQQNNNYVYITAREIGYFTWNYATNISSNYLTKYQETNGSYSSPLHGSKVTVDVYSSGEYVTTLEKNWYNGEVAFDMSPVIATIAKVGETVPYTMNLSYTDVNGLYNKLSQIGTNHAAQGYMVNQGNKFLMLSNNSVIFAQNYSRGNAKTTSNNTTLYLYGATIPYSLYMSSNGNVAIDIIYRNSAFDELHSEDYNHTFSGDSKLKNDEIQLSQAWLSGASYVDIKIESINETIRYNVIKPMKATEYYQRIRWRNSYGGWSFFDFTGQRTESRSLDVTTYQKSIYDYYTSDVTELEKIYDNDVEYTVSLKSHLIDEDGRYLFNDLIQSPYVETVVNSVRYAIIIESVNIEETDRNNIFEVTVKYRYSMKPSII